MTETHDESGDHNDVYKTHKVVELIKVSDSDIEAILNRLAPDGWVLDRIDYVKEPGVRRPQMAFLFFERPPRER